MSWLDERKRPPQRMAAAMATRAEPWTPPMLAGVPPEVLLRLSYVVVDDLDGGEVVLAVGPWPRLDDLGRPRHDPDRTVDVDLPVAAWQEMLAARRMPERLRGRAVRIGDTFAVLLGRKPNRRSLTAPVGPVMDVTADARDAARAAFYGAVTSPLDDEAAALLQDPEEDAGDVIAMPDEWVAR